MIKINNKSFKKWEKENEDDLCERYEFDINEMLRKMDNEETKRIEGYWKWAKAEYKQVKEDEKTDERKRMGVIGDNMPEPEIRR